MLARGARDGSGASLGATIQSAFWSVVSEAFDPRSDKAAVGRIAGGAALGGVVGGGIAGVGSRWLAVPTMLLVGAALSLLSMWGVNLLARQAHESPVDVRAAMALCLSQRPPATAAPRTGDRRLNDLLKSKEVIHQQLDELRWSRDPDSDSADGVRRSPPW